MRRRRSRRLPPSAADRSLIAALSAAGPRSPRRRRPRRSTTWFRRSSASRPSSIPTARSVSNLGREREGSRHRHRRERPGADHRLSDGRGACRRDRHQRRPHRAGDRRRLRPRDRLRPAAHARAAEDQAARLRQVGGRQGAGPGAGGELRRRRHGAAGARGRAAASSPEAGNIWSRARSSPARRIRPGAAPR